MPCFIVASHCREDHTKLLAKLAGQLGYAASIVPDLDRLPGQREFDEAGRHLVLVPDTTQDGALAEATVRFAQAAHHHAFAVYIAETIAPDVYKQLVRTQGGDWVKWQTLPRELTDLVKGFGSVEAPGRTAQVLSFLPSKGGVGNTTLAMETGVYLASRRKRGRSRVAILDLNLQGGTLADALDVEPRFDVREIMSRPDRLDEQLIDVFTSRYSDRLDLFASPPRHIALDDLDPGVIFSILDGISTRYDVILLDIPNRWAAWVDNVLLGSDLVVVSGGNTVPAVKQLASKLKHLDDVPIENDKIAVAVNHCAADVLGRIARRAEIERALPGRRLFYLRRDAAAADDALNTGRPLMEFAPRSRVAKDIRTLAQWVEKNTERLPAASATQSPRGKRGEGP